jgi:predicted phage tail protein
VSATPVTVPGAPAGLTAAPGDQQVTLSWDPPAPDGGSPAGGYNVYQGTSPGGEAGPPVNGSLVTSTSYQVTGLTNGSTYYFTVKAVNAQGQGAASGEVLAIPAAVPEAPAGLTATPGDAKVTLAWSAPASNGGSPVTGYNLYLATSADFKGAAEAPGVTGTALALVGLVNGTPYYFRVRRPRPPGAGLPGVCGEVVLYAAAGSPRPGGFTGGLGPAAPARRCGYAAIAAVWLMVPAAIRRSQAVRLVVTL